MKKLGALVPVRLKVSRIGLMNEWDTQWSEVPTGKHVQGCLTSDGVVIPPFMTALRTRGYGAIANL